MKIPRITIDKNSRESLPEQLEHILLQKIECGYYVPGKKIDSVRTIAKAFGVSTVSVQSALGLLKDAGALESVPGSGLFVRKDFLEEKKAADIAFVFPEEMISPHCLSPENWAVNSEIHLGLLRGAEIYGAKINFIHIDENMPAKVFRQRMAEIRKNDAAVFVGSELSSIRDTLAKEKYVFNIESEYTQAPDDVILVSSDNRDAIRRAAQYAAKCNCRTAGIITLLGDDMDRGSCKAFQIQRDLFLKYCIEEGFDAENLYDWEFRNKDDVEFSLLEKLKENKPEFIFCNYSYLAGTLYAVCMECGVKIGKDIKIMAKAPGLIFQGMIPSLTYLNPPSYETAVDVVNYACRLVRGTIKVEDLNLPKNKYQLIEGKSTGGNSI